MTYAPPSFNSAEAGTLAGLLNFILGKHAQNTDDMLPAVVVSYNKTSNRATVRPLIALVSTDKKIKQLSTIASVPVLQIGAGGGVLRFAPVAGDKGWIKACDRDISLFKKNYSDATPNTARMHSFSDGLFIPDAFLNNVTIQNEDLDNSVFQNHAGTVRVSIWPNQLKITAPNVGIGNQEGYTPDPNAALDVHSTNKAFKLPTMSTAQKLSIPSPNLGMMVFDITQDGISVFSSSGWS
jgi:Phage protein Gp138 N-terminal domain